MSIDLDVHVVELWDSEKEHAFLGEMRGMVGDKGGDCAERAGPVNEVD